MAFADELWTAWARGMQSLTLGQYLQAMSLPLSMAVAWLTFRAGTRNLRHSQVVADVTQQIRTFAERCGKLSEDIEKHYLGDYLDGFSSGAAKESRKRILAETKLLDAQREVLGVFLTLREALELQRQFDKWQAGALGDSFPVMRKEDRLKEFEQPITDLRNARVCMDRYLAELRRCCITNQRRLRRVLR